MKGSSFEMPLKVRIHINNEVVESEVSIDFHVLSPVLPLGMLSLEYLKSHIRFSIGAFLGDHESVRVGKGLYKVHLKCNAVPDAGCNSHYFYLDLLVKAKGSRLAKIAVMDYIPMDSWSSIKKDPSECAKFEVIDFDASKAVESHKNFDYEL